MFPSALEMAFKDKKACPPRGWIVPIYSHLMDNVSYMTTLSYISHSPLYLCGASDF